MPSSSSHQLAHKLLANKQQLVRKAASPPPTAALQKTTKLVLDFGTTPQLAFGAMEHRDTWQLT
eukprot:1161047-Pelagomonas_calceolata.AAC.57